MASHPDARRLGDRISTGEYSLQAFHVGTAATEPSVITNDNPGTGGLHISYDDVFARVFINIAKAIFRTVGYYSISQVPGNPAMVGSLEGMRHFSVVNERTGNGVAFSSPSADFIITHSPNNVYITGFSGDIVVHEISAATDHEQRSPAPTADWARIFLRSCRPEDTLSIFRDAAVNSAGVPPPPPAQSMQTLTNVNATVPTVDGEVPVYDALNSEYVSRLLAVEDLSDTTFATAPATGELLRHDGVSWKNSKIAIDELTDVNTAGGAGVSEGAVLTYESGVIVPKIPAGQVPPSMQELSNVNATAPTLDGEIPVYDSVAGEYVSRRIVLDDADDFVITAPAPDHIIAYNGSWWFNTPANLDMLSDVNTYGGDGAVENAVMTYESGVLVPKLPSAPPAPQSMQTLTNVSSNAPVVDGEVPVYDSVAGEYESRQLALPDMSDTTFATAPVIGQLLRHDGTAWKNSKIAIDELTDVNTAGGDGLVQGAVLTLSGSEFIPKIPLMYQGSGEVAFLPRDITVGGSNWVPQGLPWGDVIHTGAIAPTYGTLASGLKFIETPFSTTAVANATMRVDDSVYSNFPVYRPLRPQVDGITLYATFGGMNQNSGGTNYDLFSLTSAFGFNRRDENLTGTYNSATHSFSLHLQDQNSHTGICTFPTPTDTTFATLAVRYRPGGDPANNLRVYLNTPGAPVFTGSSIWRGITAPMSTAGITRLTIGGRDPAGASPMRIRTSHFILTGAVDDSTFARVFGQILTEVGAGSSASTAGDFINIGGRGESQQYVPAPVKAFRNIPNQRRGGGPVVIKLVPSTIASSAAHTIITGFGVSNTSIIMSAGSTEWWTSSTPNKVYMSGGGWLPLSTRSVFNIDANLACTRTPGGLGASTTFVVRLMLSEPTVSAGADIILAESRATIDADGDGETVSLHATWTNILSANNTITLAPHIWLTVQRLSGATADFTTLDTSRVSIQQIA